MPATVSSPDLLLARRAAAGHADAWEEIVAAFGPRLYNIAFHFTGRREEAEELTQEVFLRLHQNLRRYTGEFPFAAWALRLSRNLCIDHYRRTRRERRSTTVSDEVLAHVAAADDVEGRAQEGERLRAVYASLEEMPEETACAILLFDLQGWSLEETAASLELPVGTIKSRLHRGRLELARRVTARLAPREETAAASGGIS
jgi:RNA polymerase sigma-70 factor, ECF subfamily